ncbi:hypothetical protein BX600DRAFT_430824 [Xylariales sp. PMI_506]|nr:hypothetical protein BX600DRAFT_430824 [Xylariales sp. PMI_506]
MAYNPSWEHQYCLFCDRQTDGATYCSESCRLSDFDKCSTTSSTPASSPGLTESPLSWATPRQQPKFYLSPAYDFSNPQPYGSSSSHSRSEYTYAPTGQLSPSSSHTSLTSLQSSSSTASENGVVSEKAKKQLRDYASSFENARIQRRRSC